MSLKILVFACRESRIRCQYVDPICWKYPPAYGKFISHLPTIAMLVLRTFIVFILFTFCIEFTEALPQLPHWNLLRRAKGNGNSNANTDSGNNAPAPAPATTSSTSTSSLTTSHTTPTTSSSSIHTTPTTSTSHTTPTTSSSSSTTTHTTSSSTSSTSSSTTRTTSTSSSTSSSTSRSTSSSSSSSSTTAPVRVNALVANVAAATTSAGGVCQNLPAYGNYCDRTGCFNAYSSCITIYQGCMGASPTGQQTW